MRACLDELIDEQALNLIDVWSSLHSERQRVVHGFHREPIEDLFSEWVRYIDPPQRNHRRKIA